MPRLRSYQPLFPSVKGVLTGRTGCRSGCSGTAAGAHACGHRESRPSARAARAGAVGGDRGGSTCRPGSRLPCRGCGAAAPGCAAKISCRSLCVSMSREGRRKVRYTRRASVSRDRGILRLGVDHGRVDPARDGDRLVLALDADGAGTLHLRPAVGTDLHDDHRDLRGQAAALPSPSCSAPRPCGPAGRKEKRFPDSPPENSRVRLLESVFDAEKDSEEEASISTTSTSPAASPGPPPR